MIKEDIQYYTAIYNVLNFELEKITIPGQSRAIPCSVLSLTVANA